MPTFVESLNLALHSALDKDKRVIILGEDILDPYGGAFKVTRGLSSKFKEQVITTPVSESGILGVATGLALRGFRPIIEIMFGDFLTLTADQVINHAAKFRYMYNNQVDVPLLIRTPMGGRRGYGPTHSQTLEKILLGTPGLMIFAPNIFTDPGGLLQYCIFSVDDPVLFIENKIQYTQNLIADNDLADFVVQDTAQTISQSQTAGESITYPVRLVLRDAPPPKVTIVSYGFMAELCRQAALRLAYEEEIITDILVYSQLQPLDVSHVRTSLQTTMRLLVVEEGTLTSGWGAEFITLCLEQFGDFPFQAQRVASLETPIPASTILEEKHLPNVEDIILAVKKMV